jgi:hypothetical protein
MAAGHALTRFKVHLEESKFREKPQVCWGKDEHVMSCYSTGLHRGEADNFPFAQSEFETESFQHLYFIFGGHIL